MNRINKEGCDFYLPQLSFSVKKFIFHQMNPFTPWSFQPLKTVTDFDVPVVAKLAFFH